MIFGKRCKNCKHSEKQWGENPCNVCHRGRIYKDRWEKK